MNKPLFLLFLLLLPALACVNNSLWVATANVTNATGIINMTLEDFEVVTDWTCSGTGTMNLNSAEAQVGTYAGDWNTTATAWVYCYKDVTGKLTDDDILHILWTKQVGDNSPNLILETALMANNYAISLPEDTSWTVHHYAKSDFTENAAADWADITILRLYVNKILDKQMYFDDFYTHNMTEYVCFDWADEIASGVLSSSWYSGEIGDSLNPGIVNKNYCYNNLDTSQLCTTNNTYMETWSYQLKSVDTVGLTAASCGFGNLLCGKAYYRNDTCTGCALSGSPIPLNGTTGFKLGSETPNQIVWTVNNIGAATLSYNAYNDYGVLDPNNCTNSTWDVELGYGTSKMSPYDTYMTNVIHWNRSGTQYAEESAKITGYANVTLNNTANWATGQFGYAKSTNYTGIPFNYAQQANCTSNDITGVYTYEVWLKLSGNQDAVSNCAIVKCNAYSCAQPPICLRRTTSGANTWVWPDLYNGANRCYGGNTYPGWTLNSTDFTYIVVERNTTALNLYWNGALNMSVTCAFYPPSTAQPLIFGNHTGAPDLGTNLTFDEFRLSNSARGKEWVNQTYYSMLMNRLGTEVAGSTAANVTVFQPSSVTQSYGLYTANLKDESDNSAWDMADTQNETITFTCVSSQSILNMSSNSESFVLYDTPRVVKISVNDTTTQDVYYRKQVPTKTFPATESQDFYLVDLNVSQLVELTLSMQDWTGLFSGAEVRFKRPILTSGIIQITSDLFDAEKKAIIYLIKDMEYSIEVFKDGVTKSIGYLIIDSDTAKTITIADIAFNPEGVKLYEDVQMNAFMTSDYILGYYNDTSGTTTSVTFKIFNLTSGGELYTTTSPCNLCSFAWNYSNVLETPYLAVITAQNTVLGNLNSTWPLNYFNTTKFVGEGALSQTTFNWVAVIILVGASLAVGSQSVSAGSILFVVLSFMLYWMGWLRVNIILLSIMSIFALALAAMNRKVNE